MYVGVWCQTEVHAPALQYDPGEIGSVGHWNEVKQGCEWKSLAATSWNQWCRWCGRKQEFMKGHEFRWDHRLIIVWLSFDYRLIMIHWSAGAFRTLCRADLGWTQLTLDRFDQVWLLHFVVPLRGLLRIYFAFTSYMFEMLAQRFPMVPCCNIFRRTSNSIIRGLMAMNCWILLACCHNDNTW